MRAFPVLLPLAALLLPAVVSADVEFSIDPQQSALSVADCSFTQVRGSATLASASLGPQGAGGRASCAGMIAVTFDDPRTPTSLTIGARSQIVVGNSGEWSPASSASQGSGPGGSGNFLACFGLQGTAAGVPVTAAVANLALRAESSALAVSGASLPAGGISFTTTAGNLGYRAPAGGAIGTIRGGGPTEGLRSANAATSAATCQIANGVAQLTLPIDVTYTITSPNAQGVATATVRLTGVIVATARVP